MPGNTFGTLFAVTTFGESHGPAIGAVIDGCPPKLALTEIDIQIELDKRKPGTSRYVSERKEPDVVEILSGVFMGVTTGTPICLLIRNIDNRPNDYSDIKSVFRPGHADYTYHHKYGIRDYRGGGRSSARLTAPLVAAAAIAKKWLYEQYKIEITAYLSQLGQLLIPFESLEYIRQNSFFAPNISIINQLESYMDNLRKSSDSCGAKVCVLAKNIPIGFGEPLFAKLDADIAHALMSINAVKGVEIGSGFDSITQMGSIHGDELTPNGFLSNNSGGILGGISSGQEIHAAVAFKPTSSISKPRRSINTDNEPVIVTTYGRHDPCVGIRAVPIVESMLALVLMNHAQYKNS